MKCEYYNLDSTYLVFSKVFVCFQTNSNLIKLYQGSQFNLGWDLSLREVAILSS